MYNARHMPLLGFPMVNPKAAGRLIRAVNDLNEDVAETLGPFIAGPRPTDPIRGAYHDYTRWVCDSYAQVPDWVKNAAPGVSMAAIDSSVGEVCRRYLGDGSPRPVPPFTGGQCPTAYQIFFTNSGPGLPSTSTFVVGPVKGIRKEPPNQFGLISWEVEAPPGTWNRFRGTADNSEAWSISGVTRLDGQPDNCGNPRPKLPTPSPTRPSDPGPNPPGGGEPPIFGPRGTPIFRPGPIKSPYDEPDLPCPPIDPYYPDEGDEDDPYYGPDRPKPGDPGDPGNPENTGDGGDAEGDAPPDTELVGLRLALVRVPQSAKQYADGVYRGACYVYMGTAAGLDQDYAGSMVSDGQFVLAETGGLTKWRVVANPGYSIRVTPYYREVI